MRKLLLFLLSALIVPGQIWAIEEVYHILQKGFINVEGKSNFFDFTGTSHPHEGKLIENNNAYSGNVILHFRDLDFNLPGVPSILEREDYIDSLHFPTIQLNFEDVKPAEHPKQVPSQITLRGVTKPILIDTSFLYISPVLKITGAFSIKQSEFGIKPLHQGVLRIDDNLKIKFEVFFCETHLGIPKYHQVDFMANSALLSQEQIHILSDKKFFGCDELEGKVPK